MPYPSTVWRAFLDVSTTHDGTRGYAGYLLVEHLYMTLRRVFAGVVIGVVLGGLLGLAMGSIGWVRSVPPAAVATTARLLLTGDGQALRPSSTLRRLRRAWAVRYRRESPAPGWPARRRCPLPCSPSASASPRVICAVNGARLAALVSSTRTSKPSITIRSMVARITPVGLGGAVAAPRWPSRGCGPPECRAGAPAIPLSEDTAPRKDITNALAGRVVDLGRRADLLDSALVEHRDPVGDVERLRLVVGDQHGGDVHLVVQAAQPRPQVLADLGVQRAERLVEQQHLRDRRPAPGPTPCAAAARRTAGSGSGPESR